MNTEFVRWSCGCVGLIFPQWGEATHPTSYVIDACDDNWRDGDSGAGLYRRDMSGKDYTPLSYAEIEALFARLTRELGEAVSWRRFRALVRECKEL